MPVIGLVVTVAAAAVGLSSRERALRGPARAVEPQSPVRPQGHLRTFLGWQARRRSPRYPDIRTGLVYSGGQAMGHPVGVAIDTAGALLVADDVGNKVWRVVPEGQGR